MIFPIRTDCPLRSTPWMNWALIAANVIVYLIQLRYGGSDLGMSLSPRDPHLQHYFSYLFLHGSFTHILSNMVFLYIFGNNVNDKMGHLGYLAFYLAGGVAAGITYVLFRSPIPVIGASGAVAAVTGAFMILFPRANVTVVYFIMLIGTFEIASLWLILLFFALDLIALSPSSQVAHQAHIGGTIFGVGICYLLLWVRLLPRDAFDVLALISHWNRRRQYREQIAGGWDPFSVTGPAVGEPAPGYRGRRPGFPSPPQPADPLQEKITDLRASIAEAIAAQDLIRAADLYVELKTVDPRQVLARQAQLDVANQLNQQQRYPLAAEAYESFLRQYPKFEQIEQIELMLGLIYARYLAEYGRAKECLVRALARLHTERESAMARAELSRIEPLVR